MSDSGADKLLLIGGRLCLDFVNTVGGRRLDQSRRRAFEVAVLGEKLNDYEDLVRWSRHAGAITESETGRLIREGKRRKDEASEVLSRAIGLRESLYRLFKTIITGETKTSDLEMLNDELSKARSSERLAPSEEGFVWERTSEKNDLDLMLRSVALSAAELLTTADLSRLRECGGESCGWLFEDTSRNRSRQWCVMQTCGNLAKVRRFRSRMRRKV
ncbi:MAG: ABATE domain-containing protein [Acidobacteriota bacterium]